MNDCLEHNLIKKNTIFFGENYEYIDNITVEKDLKYQENVYTVPVKITIPDGGKIIVNEEYYLDSPTLLVLYVEKHISTGDHFHNYWSRFIVDNEEVKTIINNSNSYNE